MGLKIREKKDDLNCNCPLLKEVIFYRGIQMDGTEFQWV